MMSAGRLYNNGNRPCTWCGGAVSVINQLDQIISVVV